MIDYLDVCMLEDLNLIPTKPCDTSGQWAFLFPRPREVRWAAQGLKLLNLELLSSSLGLFYIISFCLPLSSYNVENVKDFFGRNRYITLFKHLTCKFWWVGNQKKKLWQSGKGEYILRRIFLVLSLILLFSISLKEEKLKNSFYITWIVAASSDACPSKCWHWLELCKPVVKSMIKNYILEIHN